MPGSFETVCCALGQFTANNSNTLKEIKYELKCIKGYTKNITLFCITTPEEKLLEEKLKKCKFRCIFSFKRTDYQNSPKEKLKFWLLKSK